MQISIQSNNVYCVSMCNNAANASFSYSERAQVLNINQGHFLSNFDLRVPRYLAIHEFNNQDDCTYPTHLPILGPIC